MSTARSSVAAPPATRSPSTAARLARVITRSPTLCSIQYPESPPKAMILLTGTKSSHSASAARAALGMNDCDQHMLSHTLG